MRVSLRIGAALLAATATPAMADVVRWAAPATAKPVAAGASFDVSAAPANGSDHFRQQPMTRALSQDHAFATSASGMQDVRRVRLRISDEVIDSPATRDALPEPSTWAMMLGGFGVLGLAARNRVRANVTYA